MMMITLILTQKWEKEGKTFTEKIKRSLEERHTQTHRNLIETF